MPEQETIRRAERDKEEGKSPSTQAGEFVREEMEHIRQGVHGARSTKQAIAIGLSKARRAGVDLPPPPGKKAESSRSSKRRSSSKSSRKRANSSLRALRREGSVSASPDALSRFAKASARKRGSVKPPSRRRESCSNQIAQSIEAASLRVCVKTLVTREGTTSVVPHVLALQIGFSR